MFKQRSGLRKLKSQISTFKNVRNFSAIIRARAFSYRPWTSTTSSNDRLPLKQGSESRQTLPKRVSDDSRHFIFRRRKKNRNFERPFTPRGWLRSASNFGKTRFRRFPTFHFSTPKKNFWQKFLMKIFVKKKFRRKIDKLPVFAELWIFGRNRQMRLEKLPPKF